MSTNKFSHYKFCFCFQRIFRQSVVYPPEEIRDIFADYSENGYMNADNLHRFLVDIQRQENAQKEDVQAIFDSFKHIGIIQRKGFNLQSFFRYLLSDLTPPLPEGVHHDMKAPLSHYFLFTGHNSYLTGNQLTSASSVDPIIKALKRGVRVIELDLWPDEEDIKICHGGTLTSKVDLPKCLNAIKENAFEASEFPVVITFEDHLPPARQNKVANVVLKTFEGMLYIPPSDLKELPSPENLKQRVLISTKPPKEYKEENSLELTGDLKTRNVHNTPSKKSGFIDFCKSCFSSPANKNEYTSKGLAESAPSESDKERDMLDLDEEEDEEGVAPEYKNLIAIHAGKLKSGSKIDFSCSDAEKARRVSLSEQVLENVVAKHGDSIVRFTRRNIMRVYPKGTRITSSNYNPFVGWSHGAQMVAFNMQHPGKHLWIMQGMFRANGGCGYVKKPDFLLKDGVHPIKKTLKLKIYLGDGWHSDFHHTHFDFFSPPDFYVKIRIVGVEADKKKEKTKTITDSWLPVWNEEFKFKLTVPELALLRLEVRDEDTTKPNEFGGQTCLPISELKSGIRAVPLHNEKGDKYKFVRLLMCFELISED